MRELGWAIRGARAAEGVNASELAARLGKSQSWLSKLENGKAVYFPAPEELDALARELKLSKVLMLGLAGYLPTEDQESAFQSAIRFASDFMDWAPGEYKEKVRKALADGGIPIISFPDDPDDPRAELIGLVKRVRLTPERVWLLRQQLQGMIEYDRKERGG